MANVTEELNFTFYIDLNSHMWLVATVLDSTALNSETIDGNKHQTPNEHTSSFKHQFKAIPHGSYK